MPGQNKEKDSQPERQQQECKESDQNGVQNSSASSSTSLSSASQRSSFKVPDTLQWIPKNWNWSNIKIVLRCALAAWISVVLFAIPAVEVYMGQAAYLILIASVLSPPSDPFLVVIEREVLIIGLVAATWGWCCLAMRLADLARVNRQPHISLAAAITSGGRYVEAVPTVILAVFIFLGTVVLLYIRARQGPGPYLFASILSCICLTISLTTAVMIPFPYYAIGQSILIPLGFHSVIAVLSSMVMFPQTVSAQFTARLHQVLTPLVKSIDLHRELLKMPSTSADFAKTSESLSAVVAGAEGALTPVAVSGRLLSVDIIYNRFAPTDYKDIHGLIRRMAVRANGMTTYWSIIDPLRERFPVTPGPSRPGTPGTMTPTRVPQSPRISRAPSLERSATNEDGVTLSRIITSMDEEDKSTPGTPTSTMHPVTPTSSRKPHPVNHAHLSRIITSMDEEDKGTPGTPMSTMHPVTPTSSRKPHPLNHAHFSRSHHHHHSHSHNHHHNLLHNALSHLSHLSLPRLHRKDHAVGVFESHRYLDLEATHFYDPRSEYHTERSKELLMESCDALLVSSRESLVWLSDWLENVRKGRWKFWAHQAAKDDDWRKGCANLQTLRDKHASLLEQFKTKDRHKVADPWRALFEVKEEGGDPEPAPSHRYLFNCYVYQYHLMRFATMILELLDEITRLENERRGNRLWTPVSRLVQWKGWANLNDQTIVYDEEDPDVIQGLMTGTLWDGDQDLGMPRRRDPDALPPDNAFEWVVSHVYRFITGLGGGNVLYAVKAGILTIIMCIPAFLKSTVQFSYNNRAVWAIVMAQLTLARFRGDTTFGQVVRVGSTFLGGVVGMIMWYISAGSGIGSPFGLAAVCAVTFPFFFYLRLYYPGSPMTVLIFLVTTSLIVGYSYQGKHIILPGNVGVGWELAWRRFVLVTIGVTAAFIFSFFPPSYTIRRYQRATLATTCAQIGTIYCAIISYATTRNAEEDQEIVTSLLAIRSKLNRSAVLKANAFYEYSLRGRWPAKRYHKILELQLELTYSLSHLLSVIEHMEPSWMRAFLARTRFSDPDFQGDILAVINMISTALRIGAPLPQITPCPLINRFMLKFHGLNVVLRDDENDYGVPRTLTPDTLENEQYLMFCVGVSIAFGVVTRLDRLMLAVKEVVGEDYHIHGIGLTGRGVELGPRTSTLPYRSPENV